MVIDRTRRGSPRKRIKLGFPTIERGGTHPKGRSGIA